MQNTSKKCPVCQFTQSQFIIQTPVHMKLSDKKFSFHKCLRCESIYLFDPPSSDKLSEYYDSSYLPYAAENLNGFYKYFFSIGRIITDRNKIKLLSKYFKNRKNNFNVLDYGCGCPTFLQKLHQKTNARCTGYDINSLGWDDKIGEFSNIKLISGHKDTNMFDSKFDIVTLWHALEHDFEPNNLISFLNTITNENAHVVVEVPNFNSLTRKIQNQYWAGFHTPRHSVIYTKETLVKLFETHGWKAEKIFRYGTMDSFTLWWLGHYEKIAKTKNIQKLDFQKYFLNFFIYKIILLPLFLFERFFDFGIITIIFKKSS
jgi:2-polyprenyl-3-methyl-5-hydroxy-6-metoxy-1,4-benzoquinol methylase